MIDLLRAKNVVRAAFHPDGETSELVLGPPPAPKPKKGDKNVDPLKDRREHYELQLGRPVSDEELKFLP